MAWKKVVKVLEKNGWSVIRRKGSHTRWEHAETGRRTTICFVEGSLERNKIKMVEKTFGVKLK